jgi:hypothetical protein
MRPPSFWSGSICHLLPSRVDGSKTDNLYGIETSLIPPSLCSTLVCLSRAPKVLPAWFFTYKSTTLFRNFFSKKDQAPLTGAPAIRRLKTYSAQSGYVYQYFYEGQRSLRGAEGGTEFVFSVTGDRKTWHPVSVLVGDGAVREWERTHGRQLSSTERYAVSKMALFQAFDERANPELMKNEVRVRNADVEAIIESLGL